MYQISLIAVAPPHVGFAALLQVPVFIAVTAPPLIVKEVALEQISLAGPKTQVPSSVVAAGL